MGHRRCVVGIVMLAAMSGTGVAQAGVDTFTTSGPEGGYISAMASPASAPATVYAGTAGGFVFKSTDAALTWTRSSSGLSHVGGTNSMIRDIVTSPSDPNTLWAAGYGAIYRSTDAAATWQASTGIPADASVSKIAIDPAPALSADMFAATDNGVYASTDGGVSWVRSSVGLPQGPDSRVAYWVVAGRVTAPPSQPYLLAAMNGGGVYRSLDGGATWGPFNNGLPANPFVRTIRINPADHHYAYVGGDFGVYQDSNVSGAGPWSVTSGLPASTDVGTLAIGYVAATQTTLLLAGTGDSGVYRAAIDDMNSPSVVPFVAANNGISNSGIASLAFPTPTAVYAGTVDGVYRTLNGGGLWASESSGIEATSWFDIVAAPSQGISYAVGGFFGGTVPLAKSTDGGATWLSVPLATANSAGFGVDVTHSGTVVVASSAGVEESAAGIPPWTIETHGLPPGTSFGVAASPGPDDTILARLQTGLYRSTDDGATWLPAGVGLPAFAFGLGLAFSASSPAVVYAASFGLFRSDDGGQTFHEADSGLPSGFEPSSIAIDPVDASTAYTAPVPPGTGIYKTVDGGAHWLPAGAIPGSPTVAQLVADPSSPVVVYAATSNGLYRSVDAGASWSELDNGLPAPLGVQSVAPDRTGTTLIVGTVGAALQTMTLQSDVSVAMTPPAHPAPAGTNLVFTATVAAAGSDPATNAIFAVTLPAGATLVSATPSAGSCTTAPPVQCSLGTILPGHPATVTVTLHPTISGSFAVGASASANQADPNAQNNAATATAVADLSTPTKVSPGSLSRFGLSTTIKLHLNASDAGTGVATFDVRYRRAKLGKPFGPETTWKSATTSRTLTKSVSRGDTVCVQVRARDVAGNVSSYSAERCTAIPLDDRSLKAHGRWTRAHLKKAYRATASESHTLGATLTLAVKKAKHLALVIDGCSGCGAVEVDFAGKKVVRVDVGKGSRAAGRVVELKAFKKATSGTLSIRVVKAGSKGVRIDGIGISEA